MKKGDVVQINDGFIRNVTRNGYLANRPTGVLLSERGNLSSRIWNVQFADELHHVNNSWLEPIHAVETLEARAFYESFSPVTPLPFTRAQAINEANAGGQLFPVGCEVEIWSTEAPEWNGMRGRITANNGRQYTYVGQKPADWYSDSSQWDIEDIGADFSLVTRPEGEETTAEPQQETLPREQWQVGDIVVRIGAWVYSTRNAPGDIDQELIITRVYGTLNVIEVHRTDTDTLVGLEGGWSANGFRFVRRPAVDAPTESAAQPLVAPSQWQRGDLLVRTGGTQYLRECPVGGIVIFEEPSSSRARFSWHRSPKSPVTTSYSGWHYTEDYQFLERPGSSTPAMAMPTHTAPLTLPCWLSLEGSSPAEIELFLHCLQKLGIRKTSAAYSTVQEAAITARVPEQQIGLVVGYGQTQCLFYKNDGITSGKGTLAADWNTVLELVEAKKLTPAANAAATASLPAPRTLWLEQLPPVFIIERPSEEFKNDEATRAGLMQEWYGLRGPMGRFTFVQHTQMTSTNLPSVADAFQRLHGCVRFVLPQDQKLLQNLLTQRKKMTTSSAAQKQKFSIDAAASGPHLCKAFALFMGTIGYRQENPAKTDGAYILVNGGNIFPGQPATWQYADAKNNRNYCFDLSREWEKMCERVSCKGVALPVLDADNLEREPVAGDTVVVLDTAVQEGLPETLLTLSKHVCGQAYDVTSVANGVATLSSGYRLSTVRLAVIELPKGLQNGDLVKATQDAGELVKAGDHLTYFHGNLTTAKGEVVKLAASMCAPLAETELRDALLASHNLTLPFVARITTTDMEGSGHELVINDAWPLNNQQLGFWHEAGTDKDAWYERQDFVVVTRETVGDAEVVVAKGTRAEETTVTINGAPVSVANLEKYLALALTV